MWNFQRSWFYVLKFPRGVTQFCGVSRGWNFVLSRIPMDKVKNIKIPWGFSKKFPPLAWFFSGIALHFSDWPTDRLTNQLTTDWLTDWLTDFLGNTAKTCPYDLKTQENNEIKHVFQSKSLVDHSNFLN